ncbi:hypothetical protein BVRB_2g037060 [Beta vulgaris subsp. vulgaris]|nr:hypothetical protein BVRB_2g037060 [Beta vulgaris subsp. vulgaris]
MILQCTFSPVLYTAVFTSPSHSAKQIKGRLIPIL